MTNLLIMKEMMTTGEKCAQYWNLLWVFQPCFHFVSEFKNEPKCEAIDTPSQNRTNISTLSSTRTLYLSLTETIQEKTVATEGKENCCLHLF